MKPTKKRPSRKARKRKNPHLTENPTFQWHDLTAKRRIYLKIMRDIIADSDLGKKYLESDEEAAQAFRDEGMDVPPGVKVVFLPAGDSAKLPLGAGSAIIELPAKTAAPITDEQLLNLFDCTYHIAW
jgi:hypothetical protein